jgi:NAD(P)-dependent dehydrogenase (short-subunit alcohol dehydrogenase family)
MADAFKSMPVPAYKISKAALSMLTVQYAHQYADDGFTFLGISPGVSQDIVLIPTALLI